MDPEFKFSLILPYFNEVNSIDYTLCKLLELNHQPDEILFIDSNSTDQSYNKIDMFIKDHSKKNWFNFKTMFNTPSESKNFGIQKSSFEWCAFMDFDLDFDTDWTRKQVECIIKNPNKMIFFGQINLKPKNYLDKLIILQTWGYDITSPVIPSSFIKKEYFKLNGYFKPYRSYYDKIFIKKSLKSELIYINNSVIIRYRDICYSNNFGSFFIKTINYSYQVVFINKIFPHYIYFMVFFTMIFIYFVNIYFFLFFLVTYLIIRGLVIPVIKNKLLFNKIGFYEVPMLLVVGVLYDIFKLFGYFLGFFLRISKLTMRIDGLYK